ncbi:MAG TPA: hypothetical protein VFJ16_21735 [Longimicrobium sp.]|nr:hypothetical protein [Longimicrobium sp.]
MPKLKLDVDSLSVVSYATAPEAAGARENIASRTWGCTQTTQCSYCTLVIEI